MLSCLRLTTSLAVLMLHLPLLSAEGPRVFPLWDGKEAISSYAKRVNLPATKTLDLGGGVALELVLIPAGQFIMGSEEPAKPTATVADANWLIALGGGVAALLLLALAGFLAFAARIVAEKILAVAEIKNALGRGHEPRLCLFVHVRDRTRRRGCRGNYACKRGNSPLCFDQRSFN